VAVDYPRAMAAYKVGGEGGDALCQYQVGAMYVFGHGVDLDYKQALLWVEKAAAQDDPNAVASLGSMYCNGEGVTPSWRRAREYYERAIKLGNTKAVKDMQTLTKNIQAVTSERTHHLSHTSSRSDAVAVAAPLPSSFLPLLHAQAAPLMDKRVELHGTSRADLNGKRGVATDFHAYLTDRTKDRYTVQLDGGEAFKVKPASVRAEVAGGGAPGTSKAKGKGNGKKGRAAQVSDSE